MMNQQEMNDYIEKWIPELARDFADARTGGHIYMDGPGGPLPSEIVRARRFLQRYMKELAYHDGRETPCPCYTCQEPHFPTIYLRYQLSMILCEICGNKRCPHATNHIYECSHSNELGQIGSRYRDWEKEVFLSDTDETRKGLIDRYGRCSCVTDRCINEYDDGVPCLVCENTNPFWPCFHSSTTPWPRPDQIIAEK